jgi:hypothetical protein
MRVMGRLMAGRSAAMFGTVRLYMEATVAVATMAALAVISGFAAAAITGDRTLVMVTAGVVFVLTGLVLVFRLWRMTRVTVLPVDLDS